MRLIQVIGTLVLCIVLARSINWQAFRQSIAGVRWDWVSLAALFLLSAHYANILRWRILLRPARIPLDTLVAYYGAGFFSNNFLPTGIGGDGVRAALVSRHVPWSRALVSVIFDRGIGLLGLPLFVVPGLWLGLPPYVLQLIPSLMDSTHPNWSLVILALGMVVGASGLGLYHYRRRLSELFAKYLPLQSVADPEDLGKGRLHLLIRAYLLTTFSHLGIVAAHVAVIYALSGVFAPGAAIWVTLIASIALFLPISVNGLGILESVFVVVLGAYGFAAPTALAIALLMRGLSIFYSLLGGLLSLRLGRWSTQLIAPDVKSVAHEPDL